MGASQAVFQSGTILMLGMVKLMPLFATDV